jgi:hypothetical protein
VCKNLNDSGVKHVTFPIKVEVGGDLCKTENGRPLKRMQQKLLQLTKAPFVKSVKLEVFMKNTRKLDFNMKAL